MAGRPDRLSEWRNVPHASRLRGIREVIRGDLIVCKLLQDSERAARDVEALLRRFEIASMVADAIAVASARNFRYLRRHGVTIRKTIDLMIGT